MKNTFLKATLTLGLLLVSFGALAQGPPRGQGRGGEMGGKPDASTILSMLDTNGDDAIDEDEASKDTRGKISEDFDAIDVNDDGLIDSDELDAFLSEGKAGKSVSAEKLMKTIDDDGDGKLNRLEIAAKDNQVLLENFAGIDVNNDNMLDEEELKAYFEEKGQLKR